MPKSFTFTTIEPAAFPRNPTVHVKSVKLYLQCLHFKVSVLSCKKFPSALHMTLEVLHCLITKMPTHLSVWMTELQNSVFHIHVSDWLLKTIDGSNFFFNYKFQRGKNISVRKKRSVASCMQLDRGLNPQPRYIP